jgi:alpha-L-rhamnosidase
MRLKKHPLLILLCLISANVFSAFQPVNLRCEHKDNPAGIDTPEPRFSWMIDSSVSGVFQRAWQIQISQSDEDLRSGNKPDVWDTGKIDSDINFSVVFSGIKLESAKKYFWRVRIWDQHGRRSKWSDPAGFTTGLLLQQEWEDSRWIGYESLPDSMKVVPYMHGTGDGLGEKLLKRAVTPYFRKSFPVDKTVSEAYAFVSGLGQYEFYLNGEKVSDDFLVPGWTDYSDRCLYNSYDVTSQLQQGGNVIGCLLGTGFYYINRERYRKITGAFGYPILRMILYIRYDDGSVSRIVTDETWKTFPSPVEYSSIYGGEDYNAVKELPGWNQRGYDDSGWKDVALDKGPGGLMRAQLEYPVKVMDTLEVRSVTNPAKGKYVYDFGQNASGIIELQVQGQKGDTIRITPSELLDEKGLVSQRSSGGPFYFQYILKGYGVEIWKPRFTYYGFRYAMVEGTVPGQEAGSSDSRVISLRHLHVRNSMPAAGTFSCSSALMNQIFKLVGWSVRSNIMSVSTDCPHREKMGWLEQAHLMGESVKYNYDAFHLYNKILTDMTEAQTDNGMVPSIAPEYVRFDGPFRDDPGYGSAMIVVPWYLYKWYGDKQALAASYNQMVRYITYLSSKAESNILNYGLGDWLDAGPGSPGISQLTPVALTATAFYYNNVLIMSKIAGILGNQSDAEKYGSLANAIRDSFNGRFSNKLDKTYGTGSQTSLSMPLFMGIVDPDDSRQVLDNLKKSIRANNKRITAGDIGHRFLVQALNQAGESQLLFDMNNRRDAPGYGWQIENGATALPENWSADEFLSQNHMIFGHLMEWFYNGLAGIRQQDNDAGYRNFIIEPQIVEGIDWVDASYNSMCGKIQVRWKKEKETFILDVVIPANSRADVILPVKDPERMKINGGQVKKRAGGLHEIKEEEGKVILTLVPGTYEIECEPFYNFKKR